MYSVTASPLGEQPSSTGCETGKAPSSPHHAGLDCPCGLDGHFASWPLSSQDTQPLLLALWWTPSGSSPKSDSSVLEVVTAGGSGMTLKARKQP